MIQVRRGTENDLLTLWHGENPDFAKRYCTAIADGVHEIWVACEEDGTLVGELHLRWNKPDAPTEADGVNRAYLFRFDVHPAYRGVGVASQLMHRVLDRIQKRGFCQASIGVNPNDERLCAMYRHYGFTQLVDQNSYTYTVSLPDGSQRLETEEYQVMVLEF